MRGPFLWGRRARPRLLAWASSPALDWAAAEHDGYSRLRSPVLHRRHVVFVKPDYLWVVDELEGAGEHRIEQFLHLGPALRPVTTAAHELVAASPGGAGLRALVLDDPERPAGRSLLTTVEGGRDPLQGWVSPSFGELRPAVAARVASAGPLPARLHLVLEPFARGRVPGRAAAVHALGGAAGGRALRVGAGGAEDLVVLGAGRGELAGPGCLGGAVELDGALALVRAGDGEMTVLAASGLRRLVAGGRLLAEAESPGGVDLCFRRLGELAVVEGRGGPVRLRAPGVREVRNGGPAAAAPRDGEWVTLDLGAPGAVVAAASPAGGGMPAAVPRVL
jgi:hypothetical protein